jgi:hypothetical protein
MQAALEAERSQVELGFDARHSIVELRYLAGQSIELDFYVVKSGIDSRLKTADPRLYGTDPRVYAAGACVRRVSGFLSCDRTARYSSTPLF